jgi:aspartate kinase
MKESLQVMKFGGTSMGDAACIRRAAEIVATAAQNGPVVAVVSAMAGVTNRLIKAAETSEQGDEQTAASVTSELRAQHATAISALVEDAAGRAQLTAETESILQEVANLCRGTALLRELTPRTLDAIASAGERFSARLLAASLFQLGVKSVAVDATELIVTSSEYGQAEPLIAETRLRAGERLGPLLASAQVPVVTGFIGATTEGILTTLGRGGSDYSATILGAVLDAGQIIIWTDVDGVLSADPRLVPEARLLREISYAEAAELAFFGAKVLHPKTLRPVAEAGIPVWIRNSFAPEKPGTKITPTGRPAESGVKAITSISNVSLITLGGAGIVGVVGVAAKTFAAVASVRANVLLISQASSGNDICFIVESADAQPVVKALRQAFAADLAHHQVEHITVDPEIAIVAVVGEKMRGTPGIAGRVFSALGNDNVNVIAVAQGSSEYNVSFVVSAAAMQAAVKAIHREFDLQRSSAAASVPDGELAAPAG